MSTPAFDASPRVAAELKLPLVNVRAAARLLAEGASVPFIARYRKEQTGGLDEVQLREVQERDLYYRELEQRKAAVLSEIESQQKLTPELKARIEACLVKAELEDLYLPFKPKRRTRAMIARERGLSTLAARILEQPAQGDPQAEAQALVDPAREVPDAKAALQGAKDIVAEVVAERSDVRAKVREAYFDTGMMVVKAAPGKDQAPTKFEMYYTFSERAKDLPSHRFLAINRGEAEGVLRAGIEIDQAAVSGSLCHLWPVKPGSPFAPLLAAAIDDALSRLLGPSLEVDLRVDLKLKADREAVAVFAENVRRLLLAPALGRKVVLGVDPGQRTGCKCAVVDDTGKLLAHTLFNLVAGEGALAQARKTLLSLLHTHQPQAIAVGNGTHGRETESFCREVLQEAGLGQKVLVVMVSESGASVYSASEVAREEFPDLDLTVRGAISIARRLQDPLAELVKVEPNAIGVGQYQHDVFQPLLKKKLEDVVESCVNAVGVELNTASAPLLAQVAGVGPALAKKIVRHREEKGAFASRKALLEVSGLGPKTFEQCAGFVRIRGGQHPLDQSAVHPERYGLVEKIAADAGLPLGSLVGNAAAVAQIPWQRYVSGEVGLPTLEDIQRELQKPGRDPRETFEAPRFRDDVRKLEDLAVGMLLDGLVTNVTNFGAFVDVGVHQDGLVHVSQLADRFVKDPHEVVKVGQQLKVRVLEVDLARKRIALTAKSGAPVQRPPPGQQQGALKGPQPAGAQPRGSQQRPREERPQQAPQKGFTNNPFASLLKK
jgi:protein Tex